MKFSSSTLALLLATEQVSGFSFSLSHRNGRGVAFVEQSAKTTPTALYGILDEIEGDSYNLMSTNTDEENINMSDAYEMLLGELVFSTGDPRIDIVNKLDLCTDPDYLAWLDNKIETSADPEERLALRDLYDMILDVKTKVEVNKLAEERQAAEAEKAEAARLADAEAQAEAGRSMSTADVLRKAAEIDTAGMEKEKESAQDKKTFYEEEITPEIRLSYENILKKLMPPYKGGESFSSIVFGNYEQFDAQLVKLLNERAANGDEDAKGLLAALAEEQQRRISLATESLKQVLSMGEPMKMEGAIIKLGREGKIDEPFLLLLEANADQARAAGATGPADLMDKLRKRAMDEKDKQASSKEIRLLRQLLREDDPKKREEILQAAFEPKDALLVPGTTENAQKAIDGEVQEEQKPEPEVPPPDFIDACKAVMLNFGNLGNDYDERGDLASRVKQIAAEAEVVATRIYGQGMSLREQQDRAWKEQTTSIFDLEQMEIEAERMGGRAPWTNPDANDDDMLLPGFDGKGRMQVGGN